MAKRLRSLGKGILTHLGEMDKVRIYGPVVRKLGIYISGHYNWDLVNFKGLKEI